jgi:tripartite-type tricarboxylate transporter receptor subunit TctC
MRFLLKTLMPAIALSFGAAAPAIAQQQVFPNKQVTIVAAFPPGGTVDLLSRVLGQKLSEDWRQPVIVENRPGASGIVGSQHVGRSPADGYTLMVVPITHVTNSSLFSKVPYDPIEDFTPISMLAVSPLMLVVSSNSPLKSVNDLVAQARARPGGLNCGSGGNGTSQHLACELFKHVAKVDIKHVPYKGNAAAMTDVIGGQIETLFDQMATAVPHVKGGKVRALAVTTPHRSPAMPDVPSISESGLKGAEAAAWFGIIGPKGMPTEVVDRINASLRQVLARPDVQQQLGQQGLELTPTSPEEFRNTLRSEMAKWASVIKAAGIKIE